MLTVSITGLLCPRLELLITGSLGSLAGLHQLVELSFVGRAVGGDRITIRGHDGLQSLLKSGDNCSTGVGWCGAVTRGRGVIARGQAGLDIRDDLILGGMSRVGGIAGHRSNLQTMLSLPGNSQGPA